MRQSAPGGRGTYQPQISAQCNFIRRQQGRKLLAPEKSVFALALVGERIEADQDLVDQSGVTHDDAVVRQGNEKLLHQGAEIGWPGEIIGASEAGIENDIGVPGAAAKLRAQDVEHE